MKKSPPHAYCDNCNRPSSNLAGINDRCPNIVDGKRCKGVVRSAVTVGDWKECPQCGATGCVGDTKQRCAYCGGCGWLESRRKY